MDEGRIYVPNYIILRSHVSKTHPLEKLCTQSTSFRELCTPSTSFRGAMYPKHTLLRSYVLQGLTFIISPALHTSMQFTWDELTKFNHIFSNLLHAYMISQYQTINNIDNQIKIRVPYSDSCRRLDFCNHEAILILFGFCKWEHLSHTYICYPKTWTFHIQHVILTPF